MAWAWTPHFPNANFISAAINWEPRWKNNLFRAFNQPSGMKAQLLRPNLYPRTGELYERLPAQKNGSAGGVWDWSPRWPTNRPVFSVPNGLENISKELWPRGPLSTGNNSKQPRAFPLGFAGRKISFRWNPEAAKGGSGTYAVRIWRPSGNANPEHGRPPCLHDDSPGKFQIPNSTLGASGSFHNAGWAACDNEPPSPLENEIPPSPQTPAGNTISKGFPPFQHVV